MAREDFLKHLSRVLRQGYRAAGGNGREAALADRFANLPSPVGQKWLTSDVVADYEAADFSDWTAGAKKELASAVSEFRTAVAASPPDQAKAAAALARMVAAAQPVVRDEWITAVEELIQQAEEWGRTRGWAVRRYPKEIDETLLGRYEVPQLLLHQREGRVMLDPVARFVAGGTGLVDLYAMPSLFTQPIVRRDGGWELLPTRANGRRKPWSEGAFDAAVRALVREAV